MRSCAVALAAPVILAAGCDVSLVSSLDGGPASSPPDGAILVPEGGGGPCLADGGVVDQCPGQGLVCCLGTCVNTTNDPQNCGGCGTTCSGLSSMCHQAVCAPAACTPACTAGQTCCDLPTRAPASPVCAVGAACPVACPPCG